MISIEDESGTPLRVDLLEERVTDHPNCVHARDPLTSLHNYYQQLPWGTHAWEASYGRRKLVESANSRIKRKLNGDKGLVCAFGRAAMTLGVAAMSAA